MNEEQKDILARIGIAVVLAQTAEQMIRLCMTYVLQKDSPLTYEALQRQVKEERRKTLGYFLARLRQRAELDEDFDALLNDFLEQRNTLVHGLSEIPGWSLDRADGLTVAQSFLDSFLIRTEEIIKVFAGLIRSWQEQTRISVPFPADCDFFREIDANYKVGVNEIFFEK